MATTLPDSGWVTISLAAEHVNFVLTHEPFPSVPLDDAVRTIIRGAVGTEEGKSTASRPKLVRLRWAAACELRDWLIHVRNRCSHAQGDEKQNLGAAEDTLRAVQLAMRLHSSGSSTSMFGCLP